jgi:hypothetical protein
VIGDLILQKVIDELQKALIDDLPVDDPSRAGVVQRGPLQGDPDPDIARISVTVHENDPDEFYPGSVTSLKGSWADEIAELESGQEEGGAIWNRRFTVKARALLVNTQESLAQAGQIAQQVKSRIEMTLLHIRWAGVLAGEEYVSRGVIAETMKSEVVQGGGPGSYDYHIKVRFDVQTTMNI